MTNIDHDTLRALIRDAVADAMPGAILSADEHAWVKLAIQREAQAIAFRRAVIEHTFKGLLLAGILAAVAFAREYVITHWRP